MIEHPKLPVTLKEAFAICSKITANHYENFPVASVALPKKLRPYVSAVYAFARTADDFADEAEFAGRRMEKLEEWSTLLSQMQSGIPTHPIFIALKDTAQKFDIPTTLFEDLITAFKMDCTIKNYATFDDLLHYCRHSANPVGRIILHIFGYTSPELMDYSDAICTALQLTNFWQDIAVDLEKNRIYIPQEDLMRFKYSEKELQEYVINDSLKALILFEINRTRDLFLQGKPLCGQVHGRLGFELRLTWAGGMTILDKILENDCNVFKRPILKKLDYIRMVFQSLLKV